MTISVWYVLVQCLPRLFIYGDPQEASNPHSFEPDAEHEPFRYEDVNPHHSIYIHEVPFRVALQTSTLSYLSSHFQDGVASVFVSTSDEGPEFVIQVVSNKYNPTNFW